MTNQPIISQGAYRVKIVNEDDHSILFELNDKRKGIKANEDWEVSIDPPVNDDKVECKAWFNGVNGDPLIFNVWKNRDVKFIIRKDDGIYISNYDGSDEKVFYKFFVENLLQSMAELHFFNSNACKVKIVNEDNRPILFKVDDNEKWLAPNEELEALLDPKNPSTTRICKAWFNGTMKDPFEFKVWKNKDAKFMVRKDDGIYQSDYDGSNERLYIKFSVSFPEKKPVSSMFELTESNKDKDSYLLQIENQDNHEILFELCHEKFPSQKAWVSPSKPKNFKLNYDANFTIPWLCRAWFNGVEADAMEFQILEQCDMKLMVRKDDGIYVSYLDGTNEKQFRKIALVVVQRVIHPSDQMASLNVHDSDFEDSNNEEAADVKDEEEIGDEVMVDLTVYKRYKFLDGKDGELPKCIQIVPSKRKRDTNDKWEEPQYKIARLSSYKDLSQFQIY